MLTRGNLALAPAYEASDPNSPARRAAAGASAGREVQRSALGLERDVVQRLLARLQQLKRELQGVLASAGASQFRRFTASSLILDIDRLIAEAQADLLAGTKAAFGQAQDLGASSADEPLRAARVALSRAPQLDRALATRAFDLTADLLSEPMQRFRNQLVQGVRRAAIAGEASFDELRKLAANIGDAGFDAAEFKAERMVRTELGRVLNESTFDRLLGLANQFPFLRKGWRSARDARVRQGHLEAAQTYARGHGIPVRDRFRINVHSEAPGKPPKLLGVALLRFPIDPDATPAGRLAAGATIMCRCGAFVDFNLDELRAFSTSRSRVTPEPSPAVVGEPPVVPRPAPRPPRPPRSAADVRHSLTKVADRFDQQRRNLADSHLRAQHEWLAANTRLEKLADEVIRADPRYIAAAEDVDRFLGEMNRLQRQLKANLDAETRALRRRLAVPVTDRRTIEFHIAPGAEFGTDQAFNKRTIRFRPINGAEVTKRIRQTLEEVGKLVGHGTISSIVVDRARDGSGTFVSRAFARQQNNSINLNMNETARTIAHEIGHILEFNAPDVKAAAFRFLEARTKGEALTPLSTLKPGYGYEPHERARKDKFLDPYMGKDYGLQATEIVSMGIEYFFADPAALAKADPEYFDFIFELLRGKFR